MGIMACCSMQEEELQRLQAQPAHHQGQQQGHGSGHRSSATRAHGGHGHDDEDGMFEQGFDQDHDEGAGAGPWGGGATAGGGLHGGGGHGAGPHLTQAMRELGEAVKGWSIMEGDVQVGRCWVYGS